MKSLSTALRGLGGCVVLFFLATSSPAAVLVEVGTHSLQPNLAGQVISIGITTNASDTLQDMNLYVQVADGGPTVGGTILGPKITNVDFTGPGTVFAGQIQVNTTPFPLSTPQYYEGWVSLLSGSVPASGTLAFVTLDTTGFSVGSGPFELKLAGTVGGSTDFVAFTNYTINNGQLNIVPEPASMVLGLMAFAGLGCLLAVRRRKPNA